MKNLLALILISILVLSLLTSCSGKKNYNDSIRIGVSPIPHREIIEVIEEDLRAEGIRLEIVEYQDYIRPNLDLAQGQIDANFFQHRPYLNYFKEENQVDLVSLGEVHVEPMGLYSIKIESINDLGEGSKIAIPMDITNKFRALLLLDRHGLIDLNLESKNLGNPDNIDADLIGNPRNLDIIEEEAENLPSLLKEVDGAIINGNHALANQIFPTEDALLLEDKYSPYVNILVVRQGEEKERKFVELMRLLQSEKIREFIDRKYRGGVIPAF